MSLTGPSWKAVIKKYGLNNRDLEELGSWVLVHYFGEGHQGKSWFQPGLTPEKALQHLADSPHSPITPDQLCDLWRTLPSLKAKLGREDADNELEAVNRYVKQSCKGIATATPFRGSKLSEVSDFFGDITPTMVNKIFIGAVQKVKELTRGLSPEEMEDDDLKALMDRIDIAREEAAERFAAALKASKGDMEVFLEMLLAERQVSKVDLRRVSSDELNVIKEMSLKLEPLEIEKILLTDIEEDDNFFLLFQNAVSRRLFPTKAGRPRKQQEHHEDNPEGDSE